MTKCLFVKFPSIVNLSSVLASDRDRVSFMSADKKDCQWVVTEKIDGSNFQLIVTRDQVAYAKRTAIFDKNDKMSMLTNFDQHVDKLDWITKQLQLTLNKDSFFSNIRQINLYGEYYGNGINNRVYYGEANYFKWFAMALVPENCNVVVDENRNERTEDEMWVSFAFMQAMLHCLGCGDQLVPILGRYDKFADAVAHDNTFVSKLTDEQHNSISEGYVIVPWELPIRYVDQDKVEHKLIVKNKSDQFVENKHRPKYNTQSWTNAAEQMKVAFVDYCVQSRMYGIFSKYGNPTAMSDVGKYIARFIEDARDDFVKDYPQFSELSEKEQKYVCNIGHLGFKLFKQTVQDAGLQDLIRKKD